MHTVSTSSTLTRVGWATAGALAFVAPDCLDLVSSALAQETPPDSITLTAIVRDFRGRDEPGGHADFERNKAINAGGLTQGAVAPVLGTDGNRADSRNDEIGLSLLMKTSRGVSDSQFVLVSLWCLRGCKINEAPT